MGSLAMVGLPGRLVRRPGRSFDSVESKLDDEWPESIFHRV